MNYKCIHCENFEIASDNDPGGTSAKGLCKLFSVRYFDGFQKSACSKFVKNPQSEVS